MNGMLSEKPQLAQRARIVIAPPGIELSTFLSHILVHIVSGDDILPPKYVVPCVSVYVVEVPTSRL